MFEKYRVTGYPTWMTSRVSEITISVNDLAFLVGEPHFYKDDYYPSDDYKTDYAGHLEKDGSKVSFWNYKSSHYEGIDLDRSKPITFSIWYDTPELFEELQLAYKNIDRFKKLVRITKK